MLALLGTYIVARMRRGRLKPASEPVAPADLAAQLPS
jgi:hypothetical protein